MPETELYAPVKRFLETQGYAVKAEVGPADVVAVRGDEPPVIVELKTTFSLTLVHQAIERQAISDNVYLAVPAGKGRRGMRAMQRNRGLCRRLGLGLLTVRERDGLVTVLADPAPYQPRKSKRRQTRLLDEFKRRDGDPNIGGTSRRRVVTAYRQDALRLAKFLLQHGPCKAALVAEGTGVPKARQIMYDNHYGGFRRVSNGVYELDPEAAGSDDG